MEEDKNTETQEYTYLAIQPHSWGRGETKEAAMHRCLEESGNIKEPLSVYGSTDPKVFVSDMGSVMHAIGTKVWKAGTYEPSYIKTYVLDKACDMLTTASMRLSLVYDMTERGKARDEMADALDAVYELENYFNGVAIEQEEVECSQR